MKWTPDQKKAIDAPVCDLLVTAAAGAGKTQVLSGRILSRITGEGGVDIDRILMITFTRAAAAEMKERIASEITKELETNPTPALRRQLSLLGNASITTIHSFCLEVIRSYFFHIDLDPSFRMADEAESTLLKYEALDEVLEESYREASAGFLFLADAFATARSDERLQEMILSLYEFTRSAPFPEEWLIQAKAAYNGTEEAFLSSPVATSLLEEAASLLSAARELALSGLSLVEADPDFGAYVTMFQNDIELLDRLLSTAGDWDSLFGALSTLVFERRKIVKNGDEAIKEQAAALRDQAKGLANDAKALLSCTAAEAASILNHMFPAVDALCNCVSRLDAVFTQKKKDKGVLDFNDLEHYALSILSVRDESGNLVPSEAADELRKKYQEIYIDEYQDTNLIQETIFRLISGQWCGLPNIFMVGDMKQSIYRFRQTNPELFQQKKEQYPLDGDNQCKIALSLNFRSRSQVIDAVNETFSRLMSREAGELEYDQEEYLYAGATVYHQTPPEDEKTELHVIDLEQEVGGEPLSGIQAEAILAAQRIESLLQSETFVVYDKEIDGFRRAQYRDFAILLRSVRGKAEVFEQELTLRGIPVFSDTASGYYEAMEVTTLLSLLQIIDNPLQDIPLVGVLRSPLFQFSEKELLDIKLQGGNRVFYENLCAIEDGLLGDKCRAFLSKLDHWRDMAPSMGVDEFLRYLLDDTLWYDFVGGLSAGEQRQANLRYLLEKARRFESTSYRGLFQFLRFIEKSRSRGTDDSGAKLLSEHMNVVHIMSIHKSKGLEFPVVLLCGLGSRFNLRDTSGSLLLHQSLGIGISYVDTALRSSAPTVYKQAIAAAIRRENLSEELRILYVAMTRAREKLIAMGSVASFDKSITAWEAAPRSKGKILPRHVLGARSFLDWLGMASQGNSCFSMEVHSREAMLPKAAEAALTPPFRPEPPSGEICRRLSYQYPFERVASVPSKLTVTEIKRRFEDLEAPQEPFKVPPLRQPQFLEKLFLTPVARGTLYHFAMQKLDFASIHAPGDVRAQLEKLQQRGLISQQECSLLSPEKLYGFFDTEIGRLAKQSEVHKEVPFTILVPSNLLSSNYPEKEETLIQGIIDCWFEHRGTVYLVDYKSDRATAAQIKERYQKQLELYAFALSKSLPGKDLKKTIYLFETCDIIQL